MLPAMADIADIDVEIAVAIDVAAGSRVAELELVERNGAPGARPPCPSDSSNKLGSPGKGG